MADRRQVGISDGWRGQAPFRRKVVNRRSSCLRRHQRRLKTDPGCRSKTDPPGHATERDQPSIRRPFPPAGHLPRYPEPSGHNRRNQRSRCRNCWSRYRNHQIHGAGTSGHDHRNSHTSLVGPFAAPESAHPSSLTGRQPRIQEQPRVCEHSLT